MLEKVQEGARYLWGKEEDSTDLCEVLEVKGENAHLRFLRDEWVVWLPTEIVLDMARPILGPVAAKQVFRQVYQDLDSAVYRAKKLAKAK